MAYEKRDENVYADVPPTSCLQYELGGGGCEVEAHTAANADDGGGVTPSVEIEGTFARHG